MVDVWLLVVPSGLIYDHANNLQTEPSRLESFKKTYRSSDKCHYHSTHQLEPKETEDCNRCTYENWGNPGDLKEIHGIPWNFRIPMISPGCSQVPWALNGCENRVSKRCWNFPIVWWPLVGVYPIPSILQHFINKYSASLPKNNIELHAIPEVS